MGKIGGLPAKEGGQIEVTSYMRKLNNDSTIRISRTELYKHTEIYFMFIKENCESECKCL